MSFLTFAALQKFSIDSYFDEIPDGGGDLPSGWVRLEDDSSLFGKDALLDDAGLTHNQIADIGLSFEVYRNVTTSELALAFRGTDDTWDNLVSNLLISFDEVPVSMNMAWKIGAAFAAADTSSVYETRYVAGHSLGGALAQAAVAGAWAAQQSDSDLFTLRGVTFEAPGVANELEELRQYFSPSVSGSALLSNIQSSVINVRRQWSTVSSSSFTFDHAATDVLIHVSQSERDQLIAAAREADIGYEFLKTENPKILHDIDFDTETNEAIGVASLKLSGI